VSDRGRGVRSRSERPPARGAAKEKGISIMKLTTVTQVSVDGVMQANGGRHEKLDPGMERGGWARPLFDSEAMTFVDQVYQRADAFLFGRRTYEVFAGYWGVMAPRQPACRRDRPARLPRGRRPGHAAVPATGPDIALDLVESQAFPEGITVQVYRPAGRPQYATD
jgi:dihydrofolate reductase